LPFAVCFLPFAFQKDLMFTVGLRLSEKQKAKSKEQRAKSKSLSGAAAEQVG